jgi:SAM-dependent methyltransferase
MTSSAHNAKQWDAFYASSQTRVPYTDAAVFALIALSRNPDARVFEFGCGNGQNLGFLRSVFPKARLSGCDVSAEALIAGRRLYPDLDLFVSGDALGLKPGSLDVILERATLQHIPKPLAARYVQEMFAALKPGGRAFFEVASTDHGYAAHGDGSEDPVFGHRVFYALDELKALFADFQLDQVYDRRRALVEGAELNNGRPVYDEAAFQLYLTKPA